MDNDFRMLSTEQKKDKLNLEVRQLVSIIDMVTVKSNEEYFNYEPGTISEDEFLYEEYKLIHQAKEKLISIFK